MREPVLVFPLPLCRGYNARQGNHRSDHFAIAPFSARLLWLGLAAVAVLAVAVVLLRSPAARRVLPEAGEIRSMEASFFDRGRSSKVTFQVPAAHWGPILSSPLPAHEDANPAKWVGLGQLQIKLAGGDSFLVSLCSVSEDPGAFASGPTFEQRTYYRGGSAAGLEKALEDALKASDESGSK